MSDGYVRLANKRYTSNPNDYELTFGPYSDIQEASNQDNDQIRVKFNFTNLSQLQSSSLINIDFIGVIAEIQEFGEIVIKATG